MLAVGSGHHACMLAYMVRWGEAGWVGLGSKLAGWEDDGMMGVIA